MTNYVFQSGFIALISVLIVSSVLLTTTLSLAQLGITSRYFILKLEHKAVTERLSEACVHIGRIMVFNDPKTTFTTSYTIPVGDHVCLIKSITRNNSVSTIITQSSSSNAHTTYQVEVNNQNGSFLSWIESDNL